MARPKVFVHKENAKEIYHYFSKSLYEGRLFKNESPKKDKAQKAFSQLSSSHDINKIEDFCKELQSWVDTYVSLDKWKRCLATLRQIRSTQRHDVKSIKLNKDIYKLLNQYADKQNLSIQKAVYEALKLAQEASGYAVTESYTQSSSLLSSNGNSTVSLSSPVYEKIKQWSEEIKATPESVLTYLIEQEAERLLLLNDADEASGHETQRYSKLKEITELCTTSFSQLNHESEMFHVICVVEDLYKTLLKKGILSAKVDPTSIIDSRRIYVPQVNYYYFGGTLAKYTARWFGTFDLYMNFEFCPEQTVMFIGMPNNVNVSETVFDLLYRLFCQIKSNYKKTFGLKSKIKGSERNNLTDMHLSRLSQQLEYTKAWIGDEDDFKHLCDYAQEHYSFALR